MIHVIATVLIKPGKMAEALEIYRPFTSQVLTEKGCLQYQPSLDLDLGLATQRLDPNRITVIERWENIAAFRAHLNAPHVLDYRAAIQELLQEITVTVTQAVI
jgi:quinol monooxygenase YgiN